MGFIWAAFSVILAGVLAYVPHVARVVLLRKYGKFDNTNPRDYDGQLRSVPEERKALIERLVGCHVNQIETLSVYAAGVAANLAVRGSGSIFVAITTLYIAFRIAYIAANVGPQVLDGYVRSGMFVGSMIMIILLWVRAAF